MTALATSPVRPGLSEWAVRSARALLLRTGIGRSHFHKQRALRVLCYHGVCPDEVIGEPWIPDYFVSASQFAEQMAYLKELGPILDLVDAVEALDRGDMRSDSCTAITFDDVAACSFVHAAPVLETLGIQAAFFVATGPASSGRLFPADVLALTALYATDPDCPASPAVRQLIDHPALHKRMPIEDVTSALADVEVWLRETLDEEIIANLRAMNWREVAELAQMGHAVGPHTVDHAILGWQQTRTRRSQISESVDEVATRIGAAPICFAYPNGGPGDFGEPDERALRRAGVRFAFSTRAGFCTPATDLLALPRICIGKYHTLEKFALEVSGLLDRRRRRQQGWN